MPQLTQPVLCAQHHAADRGPCNTAHVRGGYTQWSAMVSRLSHSSQQQKHYPSLRISKRLPPSWQPILRNYIYAHPLACTRTEYTLRGISNDSYSLTLTLTNSWISLHRAKHVNHFSSRSTICLRWNDHASIACWWFCILNKIQKVNKNGKLVPILWRTKTLFVSQRVKTLYLASVLRLRPVCAIESWGSSWLNRRIWSWNDDVMKRLSTSRRRYF